jgi:glycosyltransferase involved in cell wall biosynthesis
MILLIGNFGNSKNRTIGGQHVRTRSILRLLQNELSEKIYTIDLSKNLFLQMPNIFIGLIYSKKIILLPGKNFLKLASQAKFIFRNKRIYMVAIGGWLWQSCQNKKIRSFLMQLECLWVQTGGLKSRLSDCGVNSTLLPNFKYVNNFQIVEKNYSTINVVFCSRVSRDKGIIEAISAFKDMPLNYHLHIYGPKHGVDIKSITDGQTNITFYGEIDPFDVPSVISKYHIFLFPTYHKGEGFPGVIIDAFYASLPVVATDWRYNAELITSDLGLLINIKSSKAIKDALLSLGSDHKKLISMSKCSGLRGKNFSPEKIAPILINPLMEFK